MTMTSIKPHFFSARRLNLHQQHASKFTEHDTRTNVDENNNLINITKKQNIMKKIILSIVAMLTIGTAMAQGGGQFGGRFGGMKPMTVEQRTDKMVKDLELNEEQSAKVKELNTKYASMWERPNMGPRGNGEMPDSIKNMSREQMREQMQARFKEMREKQEAYNNELKEIVGDEKFAKYQKQQKRQMQRMRNNMNRGGFGGGFPGGGGGFPGGGRGFGGGGFGGGDDF